MAGFLLAACSSGDTSTATTSTAGPTTVTTTDRPVELDPGDDIYAVPADMQDLAHGTLLTYQAVQRSPFDGASTYRILYTSTAHNGGTIAVSGLAVVPDAPAPPGGRNIVTLVHGTTGSADHCAPSKDPANPGELHLLEPLVDAGYLVAATDYEGHGTPGAHPYLVGESEGRSGLDAALAARQLPTADAGTRFGIMGYSQGGHAAMWTAELAATWAPELELVGTFAGAPASEIGLIQGARLTGSSASFVVLLANGFVQHYGPELDIAGFLTPEGQAFLPQAEQECIGDLARSLADFPATSYVDPPDPAWAEHADANDAGTEKVDAPLLIIHSPTDDIVPAILSEIATDRLCGLGQVVERRTPEYGSHGDAAPPAYADAITWMQDRFADDGPPALSTC